MIDRVFPTGAQPTSIITTIEVEKEDNRKNLKYFKASATFIFDMKHLNTVKTTLLFRFAVHSVPPNDSRFREGNGRSVTFREISLTFLEDMIHLDHSKILLSNLLRKIFHRIVFKFQ